MIAELTGAALEGAAVLLVIGGAGRSRRWWLASGAAATGGAAFMAGAAWAPGAACLALALAIWAAPRVPAIRRQWKRLRGKNGS